MQLLARLLDWALDERGQRATVVGATSGDTVYLINNTVIFNK
jgi:threonine synthase